MEFVQLFDSIVVERQILQLEFVCRENSLRSRRLPFGQAVQSRFKPLAYFSEF